MFVLNSGAGEAGGQSHPSAGGGGGNGSEREQERREGMEVINRIELQRLAQPAVPLPKQVAKRDRENWAKLQVDLKDEIELAKKEGDKEREDVAWKWLQFSHVLFLRANGKKRGRGRKPTDTPTTRFDAWEKKDFGRIVRAFLAADDGSNRRIQRAEQNQIQRALELLGQAELSKAKRMLLSHGTADLSNPKIQEQLEAKHPKRTFEQLPEVPPQAEQVKVELEERYRKLRWVSGTGPDRYKTSYLKVLTYRYADTKAAKAIQAHQCVAGWFLNGEAPDWVYVVSAASRMVALIKFPAAEGETPEVRPIAVGGVRERAWLAQAVADVTKEVKKELWPTQMAIGVPSGLEKLAFALRLHMEINPEHVIVKFDFANAYNTCKRVEALKCIMSSRAAKALATVFRATHQPKAELVGINAKSEEGVRQGNPLSSLAFCLSIKQDVEWANSELQKFGGGCKFDMDDSYAFGPMKEVFRVANELARRLEERCGIKLQPKKSKAFCKDTDALRTFLQEHPEYQYTIGGLEDGTGFGIMTSGLPLGDAAFVQARLKAKVDKICEGIHTITTTLQSVSTQSLYAMLVLCCHPQLTYEMRTIPPGTLEGHLNRVDAALFEAAKTATGIELESVQFASRRLRLPKRLYGGALRSLVDVSPAAYIAGMCESLTCFTNGPDEPGFLHQEGLQVLGPHVRTSKERFAVMCNRTESSLGSILQEEWRKLQAKVATGEAVMPLDGPLSVDAQSAGLNCEGQEYGKLQATITEQVDMANFEALDTEIKAIPEGHEHWSFKQQWLSMDKYSTQFIASIPRDLEPESTINIEHFTTACEMYFNAKHRIIAPLVGTEFTWRKGTKVKIDARGHALCSTAGKRTLDARHDKMKWLLDSLLSAAHVQHSTEALNVFALGTGGRGQGLIPDFVLYDNGGARLADVKGTMSVCPSCNRRHWFVSYFGGLSRFPCCDARCLAQVPIEIRTHPSC